MILVGYIDIMDDVSRFITTLQRVPQFSGLTDETQEAIAASAIHRHFNSGQVIYVEGEPAESIYLLESGWIKATRMTRRVASKR